MVFLRHHDHVHKLKVKVNITVTMHLSSVDGIIDCVKCRLIPLSRVVYVSYTIFSW